MPRIYEKKLDSTASAIKAEIMRADSIAVFCHINPDGDTVGSGLALARAFERMGKRVGRFCENTVSAACNELYGANSFKNTVDGEYDLFVSVDCADLLRIGGILGETFKKKSESINIDHHISNTRYAKHNLVCAEASCCEIIFWLLTDILCIELDKEIAECLFAGILTDTGGFLHSSTTPQTHYTVSKLLEYNIDHELIVNTFLKKRSIAKTRLIARAISSLRLFNDGRIAVFHLTKKDFDETEASPSETEGIVDYAVNINGVLVGVSVSQQNPIFWKVSVRTAEGIDASDICASFGGGGHKRAAGCGLGGNIEDVLEKIVKACSDRMP